MSFSNSATRNGLLLMHCTFMCMCMSASELKSRWETNGWRIYVCIAMYSYVQSSWYFLLCEPIVGGLVWHAAAGKWLGLCLSGVTMCCVYFWRRRVDHLIRQESETLSRVNYNEWWKLSIYDLLQKIRRVQFLEMLQNCNKQKLDLCPLSLIHFKVGLKLRTTWLLKIYSMFSFGWLKFLEIHK